MMTPLLLCLLAGGTPGADPFLAPTQAVADKGDVRGGPPLLHSFELKHNTGAGNVVITGVEAACGCHRHAISNRVLAPGEKSTLTVEVNTLTQPAGKNQWKIRVNFQHEPPNAPSIAGSVDVTVTANLTHEVSVSPAQLAISTTGETTPTITVTDHRAQGTLSVLKISTSNTHLTATAGAVTLIDGKRTQVMQLKLANTVPNGQTDETVVLYTDDVAYPELRIPVRVVKKAPGAVSAFPEKATVTLAKAAKASALVQIRGTEGKTVAITKAECTTPGVSLKWSPDSGVVATVRVTIDTSTTTARKGSATVIVTMAEPAGHTIAIPVVWAD